MRGRGVDNSAVKKNNQKLILSTIFENGVISRVEISKLLSLSKPAVNEHIDQLLNIGVIREIGEGEADRKGGRRPIMIEPNPDYKINIALDLNFTKPQLAFGTITGTPLDRVRLDAPASVESFCDILIKAIDGLLDKHMFEKDKIGLIVISTPGIINETTGEIYINSQFKSRNMFVIKNLLQKTYGAKIILKNDVNMAALAEANFLKKDLLFVSCGLGVGAAIVINGELYEGKNFAAGEIGYFMNDEDFITLDERICIDTLLKRLGLDTFDDALKAYEAGEQYVISEIKKIGRIMGISINNAVSMADLQHIVIGGDYLAFSDVIFKEINFVMEKSRLPKKPEISAAALQYAGGVIGCFAVATNFIINEIYKEVF